MQEMVNEYYLWIKALHLIAVISWMAGLLYLPRLFVYHAGTKEESTQSETFKIMERKLLRFIMNPAMIATWVFGLAMIYAMPELMKEGWMHAKLTAVVLLTGFHHLLAWHRKRFFRDENKHSGHYFRMVNEVPTILMIAAVILVIVRPF